MSTHSLIGKVNKDNSITYIYCHFDGYMEHNGRILQEHYTKESKVDDLLKLGDLSILGEEIGEKHDFNDYDLTTAKKWCRAYGRDRGETDIEARTVQSANNIVGQEEYVYLFEDNKWKCFNWDREIKF